MIAIILGMVMFLLTGCLSTSDDLVKIDNTHIEPITYTMGRKIVKNPKLPQGDTYEDNAYTRYIKEELNAVCINKFEATAEEYDRQVALAIASGDIPDIMHIGDRDILKELVEKDLIADLTETYFKHSSDYVREVYNSYDGRVLKEAVFDGKLMALPGTNVDSAPNQVWIREDWMEELGIEIDKDESGTITIDELEEVARLFLENDPGKSGDPVAIPMVNWLNVDDYNVSTFCMTGIASLFESYPKLWLKNDDGEVYYGSTTEGTKQALGLLKRWYKEGILDPQFGTRTWDDIANLYVSGQTGIAFGVWHTPDWLLNNIKEVDNKASFATYALEDKDGKVNVFHNNPAGGFIVVRKDYEYPELAIKIGNLFHDELANSKTLEIDAPEVAQYQKAAVDGSVRPFDIVVNKNTSLLDDYHEIKQGLNGTIKLDEVSTVESRININSAKRYLEDPQGASVTDWAKYHSRMKGVALIDKLTNDKRFNWVEPVFWGTTDTMRKQGEILDKLEEEIFIQIVTGLMPLDEFDTFVEKWKELGGDQIIEEITHNIKTNEISHIKKGLD